MEVSQCLTSGTFSVYVCNLMITVVGYIGHAKLCNSHIKCKSPQVKSYLEYCVQSLDIYFEGDINKLRHTYRKMTRIFK